MAPNKRSALATVPTDWLLESDNPSVCYLTLRYLLGRSEDSPEVKAARAAIPRSRVVERIFARQSPDGCWGDPVSPYLPKYKASYWTLMLLGHLAMSREDARVQRAVEYIFRFQQPIGGFAERGEEMARQEYVRVVQQRRAKGKEPPEESAFVADLVHQSILSCLTGNVVAALLRLGYDDDPRLWRAVDWLVSIQHADGGWLCPYWKAHVRDKHSCFYGAISVLEAFAEIPKDKRPPAVREAAARGAEFLLMHRLYRADHHGFRVINPGWLELSFPWFYRYHVLRGLWVLTRLGYHDERMEDALTVLCGKQTSEGKWVLEGTPYGRMQANLEKKGEPSKWLTLYALGVLKAVEESG
ncbi:MAG: hypothetical protein NUW24_16685 [Anaerolineae bacterium]|jgi:hypothetical protein|nr:hypothetical protein [Anaerolineae bacterium]MDH7474382.1 prenyltransferase/squalene oxidase repeat-containing protein [Anaerolineae bacterium]